MTSCIQVLCHHGFNWSPGDDTYVGGITEGGNHRGGISFLHYSHLVDHGSQGFNVDNSTNELVVQTTHGTTTATNLNYIAGSYVNDTIIGSHNRDGITGNGGTDTITGNGGSDHYTVFTFQDQLTVTDYESHEEICFQGVSWADNGFFNFESNKIHDQLSIQYNPNQMLRPFLLRQIILLIAIWSFFLTDVLSFPITGCGIL